LLRRSHLDSIGGIAGQTITEDAETSLGLHAKGLKSVYVNKPMVCGLSPETFSDFITQRTRWAQGMIQIFVLKNPLFQKGLSWYQRICYTNNCLFWLFGAARAIFFIAPLMYLLFGLKVYNASLTQVLAFTIPHVFGAVMLSDFLYGHVRHPFFSELYEAVQSFFNIPALLSTLIRPKAPSFKVTPKLQDLAEERLSPLAGPFYPLLFMSAAAYPAAMNRFVTHPAELDTILICLFWATFNLMLVFLCLGVVWEKHQYRRRHRLPTEEEGTVDFQNQDRTAIPVKLKNISEEGVGLEVMGEEAIRPGRDAVLKVTDSYGMGYLLPCEVVRSVTSDQGGLFLGCRFVVRDVSTRAAVIGYVYGDSRRWERFWIGRRRQRVGVVQGSFRLFFLGVRGTARHMFGLLGAARGLVARQWTKLWMSKATL
jgi:cellulose synthase (UDP-forming)